MLLNNVFILIVTYNELNNLVKLVPVLLATGRRLVIVDDNSPDGSPAWLEKTAAENPLLTPIIRKNERGYGTAVLAGLAYIEQQQADAIVTLDADFSHDPAEIPGMIAALEKHDVALGSRYVGGCRVLNWQLSRLFISVGANYYLKLLLGFPYHDCTSGFRAYRVEALKRLNIRRINSNGYSILVEILYQLHRLGASIHEHPIVYSERREGQSKMSGKVIFEAAINPFRFRLKYLGFGKQ